MNDVAMYQQFVLFQKNKIKIHFEKTYSCAHDCDMWHIHKYFKFILSTLEKKLCKKNVNRGTYLSKLVT